MESRVVWNPAGQLTIVTDGAGSRQLEQSETDTYNSLSILAMKIPATQAEMPSSSFSNSTAKINRVMLALHPSRQRKAVWRFIAKPELPQNLFVRIPSPRAREARDRSIAAAVSSEISFSSTGAEASELDSVLVIS
jgi:hypothetical protein